MWSKAKLYRYNKQAFAEATAASKRGFHAEIADPIAIGYIESFNGWRHNSPPAAGFEGSWQVSFHQHIQVRRQKRCHGQ